MESWTPAGTGEVYDASLDGTLCSNVENPSLSVVSRLSLPPPPYENTMLSGYPVVQARLFQELHLDPNRLSPAFANERVPVSVYGKLSDLDRTQNVFSAAYLPISVALGVHTY